MQKIIKLSIFSFFLFSILLIPSISRAQEDFTTAVYFTGVGCSHCAKADPLVLQEMTKNHSDFVVIEYEIYRQKINGPLISQYNDQYQSGLGIPIIFFSQDDYLVGDSAIVEQIELKIQENKSNYPPLLGDANLSFSQLDLTSLPGEPKIWRDDRVLIRNYKDDAWIFAWNNSPILDEIVKQDDNIANNDSILQELIQTENLKEALINAKFIPLGKIGVYLSGQQVVFDSAIKFKAIKDEDIENHLLPVSSNETCKQDFTLAKILSLAAVDAINPCALAVLALMLIAILSYNPRNKKNILLAGLSFSLSVFIMYLVYGLLIIKFFQLIQALNAVKLWMYRSLGLIAIILGLLNLKDFICYKSGGIGTEMPMFLRPKVKKIISGVTSPAGAFITGAFVTLFLLPCTIGPYVICGGLLSVLGMVKSLPWLLLYNFIFILPMLIITGLVYLGIAKVQDVTGWKDKNIRYLHLISGLIILFLGLAIAFGWV